MPSTLVLFGAFLLISIVPISIIFIVAKKWGKYLFKKAWWVLTGIKGGFTQEGWFKKKK